MAFILLIWCRPLYILGERKPTACAYYFAYVLVLNENVKIYQKNQKLNNPEQLLDNQDKFALNLKIRRTLTIMSNFLDEKLIKAAIEGDTEAKEMLKDRIQSVALPTIKKRGIQDSDEDVKVLANQIEEKVLNALHQFRFQVSLQTWIHRITVNMIIGYQRRIMGRQPMLQSMNGK